MSIKGTLNTMSVPDLLQFLAAGRKTGTLRFNRDELMKEIYLQNGLVVGANTNDPKEYLGQVLIHYGKIDEPQLQVVMEEQRRSGGRLGEIVVEKGFMTTEGVLEILRIRALDIIYDLFIWEDAHFEFFDKSPFPADLIRIEVEPTTIIMEGIYRVDELSRYRTVIPSELAVLEPTDRPTADLSPKVRQLLAYVEKRMTVAEICYNMHDSSFNVYGQLFDLVNEGLAQVVEELPQPAPALPAVDETATLFASARQELAAHNPGNAISLMHRVLQLEPKNEEAQSLLKTAESEFVKQVYQRLSPQSVPRILLTPVALTEQQLGPQEAFLLSRINGEWDIQSVLSICPFREADCLRMMLTLKDAGIIGF